MLSLPTHTMALPGHMHNLITIMHKLLMLATHITDITNMVINIIKDSKLKVQASIQGEQLRVTGKKRDDLQSTMALIKSSDLGQPFQYKNFRD